MSPDGPLLRSRLLAAGYRTGELHRMRAAGSIVSVRPGAYVPADDERLRDPVARHGLAVRAAVQQIGAGAVVSHVSAAVLHGIPLWSVPLQRVHVTRQRRSGGRRTAFLHLHAAALGPDEITLVEGVATTSVARTLSDLARTLPFEQAVVLADAALLGRMIDPAALAAAVARAAHRRGNGAAGRVVAFADGAAESVGESRSRVAIARAGLPPPVLQWNVHARSGAWLGRVDFGWVPQRAVGEFDGRVKYGRTLRPGQDVAEVLFEEKRREDALRAEVRGFVRWTWADLDDFAPLAARLRRVLGM